MIRLEDIEEIEIDVTSYCNAGCPACARTQQKGKFELQHLTQEMWDKLFAQPLLNLKRINFNGNYGDFIMHPTVHIFLLDLSKKFPDIKIQINTNGGIRSKSYWSELASILKKFRQHEVVFSIDGLREEYESYRIGCQYKKVIQNASAFISNGGNAVWSFIEFQSNTHQIEEAKKIASDLGFSYFKVKRSYCDTIISSNGSIFKRVNTTRQIVTKKEQISNNYCVMRDRYKMIFVDFAGNVWPCCWTADSLYRTYYGSDNSLKTFDLSYILSSSFAKHFTNEINSKEGMCENFCRKKYV